MKSKSDEIEKEMEKEIKEEIIEAENELDSNNASNSDSSSFENLDELLSTKIKEIEDLSVAIQKKDQELSSLKDMMLRRQADFENYKKRVIQKEADQKKLAVKDMAIEILGINDDLLRALDAAKNVSPDQLQQSNDSFVSGITMISGRIEETLKNFGIVEIESLNTEFDPVFNEAVEINTSEDVSVDTITKVYQKGFKLDDYVIRTAKVCVTKPATKCN